MSSVISLATLAAWLDGIVHQSVIHQTEISQQPVSCIIVCTDICHPRKMKPTEFDDPLSFHQEFDLFCFLLKCLNNSVLPKIWSTYPSSPQDEL